MLFFPDKTNLNDYLRADREVDRRHPAVEARAEALSAGCENEEAAVRAAFEFVCNGIAHSADIRSRRITRTASEVLLQGEGICYAKSMLLAALLRHCGIPCGFCYQELRLTDAPGAPLAVHALNAVFLRSRRTWTRLDARGNTGGIRARFVPDEEHLAFPVRPELGESEDPAIYAAPHPAVVRTLHGFSDCREMFRHLPERLESAGHAPGIFPARREDLPEILKLQYLAYRSEAELLGNPDIPPLKQTSAELETEFRQGLILKAQDGDGRIIGSVRFCRAGDTVRIGKLMVAPDQQGRGLGTRLLVRAESLFPGMRLELFTGRRSVRNIALYERCGFRKCREEVTPGGLTLVYLEKNS